MIHVLPNLVPFVFILDSSAMLSTPSVSTLQSPRINCISTYYGVSLIPNSNEQTMTNEEKNFMPILSILIEIERSIKEMNERLITLRTHINSNYENNLAVDEALQQCKVLINEINRLVTQELTNRIMEIDCRTPVNHELLKAIAIILIHHKNVLTSVYNHIKDIFSQSKELQKYFEINKLDSSQIIRSLSKHIKKDNNLLEDLLRIVMQDVDLPNFSAKILKELAASCSDEWQSFLSKEEQYDTFGIIKSYLFPSNQEPEVINTDALVNDFLINGIHNQRIQQISTNKCLNIDFFIKEKIYIADEVSECTVILLKQKGKMFILHIPSLRSIAGGYDATGQWNTPLPELIKQLNANEPIKVLSINQRTDCADEIKELSRRFKDEKSENLMIDLHRHFKVPKNFTAESAQKNSGVEFFANLRKHSFESQGNQYNASFQVLYRPDRQELKLYLVKQNKIVETLSCNNLLNEVFNETALTLQGNLLAK